MRVRSNRYRPLAQRGNHCPTSAPGVGSAVLLRRTCAGGLTGAGADAACKGVISDGECVDKTHIDAGACGLCYGDGPDKSLPTENAYFYRMISDVYAYEGVLVRAACTRPLALGTRDCRHGTVRHSECAGDTRRRMGSGLVLRDVA